MSSPTAASLRLRALVASHTVDVAEVLRRYGASRPRIFGSVARGEAVDDSDIDLLVELDDTGNPLFRIAGLSEELSTLLGVRVDVVAPTLLRDEVSATALADAVAV